MRVSHETIYQSLFAQGRGALRAELTHCLRTDRARRRPAGRARPSGELPDMVLLSERPAEVEDRAVPGHWEGDLIIGKGNRSAIGTLVERQTRCVLLVALPHGRTAEAVRGALAERILTLPAQLRRSLIWDRGKEMAEHVRFTVDTGVTSTSAIRTAPGSGAATRTPTWSTTPRWNGSSRSVLTSETTSNSS